MRMSRASRLPFILRCLLGSPAALACDNVRGVPLRPVVLRSGGFVRAMVLLCLPQKVGQSRHVQAAESSSGKSRLDLLEQPAVAVRIAERSPRAIGVTVRIRPRYASLRPGYMEAGVEMEHLAHVDAMSDKLGARCLDVIDDEERSLNRARYRRRDPFAEDDGAR